MKDEQEVGKYPQKLGQILIHHKIITPEQLEKGLKIKNDRELPHI